MENRYDVIMLGRDAQIVEDALANYKGNKIKLNSIKRDPNTTERLYACNKNFIHVLYNEYADSTLVGEDIPEQERCNIGITIIGPDTEAAKKTLETIVGKELIPGRKTKKISEEGIR